MLLADAVRKAENDKLVKKLSKDHFLCSAFAFIKDDDIKEWILHYFSPENKKMVDCFVSNTVTIGDETPAIKDMKELNPGKIKITYKKAVTIIKKNFEKKIVSSMISLHQKEKIIWTVSMITQDMMITSFDLDAITGEIIEKKEESLIRRSSS
jgi:uncharacterized membrane protein YkoI